MQNAKLIFSKTSRFSLLTSHFQFGQSLIEVLIALGLTAILLPALLTGLVASREGKAQEGQRLQATALLREAEDAVRSVRERNWNTFAQNGTFHPQISGSSWSLVAGAESVDGYTRQIEISEVFRDQNFNITESGGILDTSSKKIVSTVSWNSPLSSKVASTTYLQRHLQNTTWDQTSVGHFNAGTHINTRTVQKPQPGDGAVELAPVPATTVDYGNKFLVTGITGIGNMTSANHKTALRFTAQESKTVTAIRVYLQAENGTSPTYRYGIQTNNPIFGNIPSGAWVGNFGTLQATTPGWKTVNLGTPASLTSGNIYHIVVEPAGSPNPTATNYISIRRSTPLNYIYPKTNISDTNANTLFKTRAAGSWSIQNFQPIYELDFSDSTYEGNPYISNTETSIFGANWLAEKFTVTGGDKTPQSVSFYLRRNASPPNNLIVELRDNANQSLYNGVIATPSTPATYAYVTHNFTSQITLTSGQTYRIILRTTAGSNVNTYRIIIINAENALNFNSITYDGINSVYSTSSNGGGSWTDNNQRDIGGFYFTIQTQGNYASSGNFTSQIRNVGSIVAFNNITWTENVPIGTNLEFEVSTDGGLTFFGPTGVGSRYTQPGAIPLNFLNFINGQFVRYRAYFTGGAQTPTLFDVSINYSP